MKLSVPLKTPSQKIKAALIPALALGLAWTLFSKAADSIEPLSNSPVKTDPPISQKNVGPARTKDWNELSLEEIVAFNPFPLPAPIPRQNPLETIKQEKPAESAKQAEITPGIRLWETQRVSIVYQGPNGPLAVIGNETVGVGDMLDKTTRVVGIREDGVWVSQETNEAGRAAALQAFVSAASQSATVFWDRLSKIGKKFGF